MPIKSIIILLLFTPCLFAQKTVVNEYVAIDKIALRLPDSLTASTEKIAGYIVSNFKTDNEKTRAIFIWVASNIQYDIENMYALNFYEEQKEKITKCLNNKKGICENYAAVFNDICLKSGIKSFVITGYTKQNGFADYIPHAWCCALIDSSWFMFDPTWGSGYVSNSKFYEKINNAYFKVPPISLIKSHMPFDFLWEFLDYPVSNQEFYEGKTQLNKSKSYFNYKDSILVYEKQNHMERLRFSASRIERNGLKNSLIFDRLQHIKLEIEHLKQTKTINLYNLSVADYNDGVRGLNDFINYRNNQFSPIKTDSEIQNMIDVISNKLNNAIAKLDQITDAGPNTMQLKTQLIKSIDDAKAQVKAQQNWLTQYFSKGKSGRKSMFYEKKITWFGIPIN